MDSKTKAQKRSAKEKARQAERAKERHAELRADEAAYRAYRERENKRHRDAYKTAVEKTPAERAAYNKIRREWAQRNTGKAVQGANLPPVARQGQGADVPPAAKAAPPVPVQMPMVPLEDVVVIHPLPHEEPVAGTSQPRQSRRRREPTPEPPAPEPSRPFRIKDMRDVSVFWGIDD